MQGVKGLCPALGQTGHSTSSRNRCRGPVSVRAEDKPELLPKPTLSPKPQRRPAPQQQRQTPARDVQQYKQPPQDSNGNGVGRQQGQQGRGFSQQQSFNDGRGSNGAGRGLKRTDTFQRQPSSSGRGRNFDSQQQQQRPYNGAANGGQHRNGPVSGEPERPQWRGSQDRPGAASMSNAVGQPAGRGGQMGSPEASAQGPAPTSHREPAPAPPQAASPAQASAQARPAPPQAASPAQAPVQALPALEAKPMRRKEPMPTLERPPQRRLQEQVDQQRLQEHQHPNRKPQEQQQRSGQGGPGGPGQPQQGQQRWQDNRGRGPQGQNGQMPQDGGRGGRGQKQPSRHDMATAEGLDVFRRSKGLPMKAATLDDAKRGVVDINARRSARAQRRQQRQEGRDMGPGKEEIFEVGNEGLSVADVAANLALSPEQVIADLFMVGIMANVNQVLDRETIATIAEKYEVEVVEKDADAVDTAAKKDRAWIDQKDLEHLQPRPPVVTVMGHVDHGKTSLLDYIRKAKVAAGEAGGITQAIGAYTCDVAVDGGVSQVTFLDTPGHEAFSAMRARGTRVTDIAVIVVAADDGVRPQTIEAISHAKAAGVPLVVAINKIDKEGANIERVRNELSEQGLVWDQWGGDTSMLPISAKKGTGVDELLETLALTAEVEDLQANPERAAAGTVIEAHLDKRMGAVTTLLVQTGTLRVGDVIQTGSCYGKARSMQDNIGDCTEAGPSRAVQMIGLNNVPVAGDEFIVLPSIDEARKTAGAASDAQRLDRLTEQSSGTMITTRSMASMDDEEEAVQRINVILKADASGTLEAVKGALAALPQEAVALRFLLASANDMTESDIDLADVSDAMIIGFNMEPSESVIAAAKSRGVTVKSYNIIYELLDDMRAAMEGRLAPSEERVPLGKAEVRAVFGKGSKLVAGCMVTDGQLRSESFITVKRKRKIVWEGNVTSLRRVKETVETVEQGNECGVGCKEFNGWQEGDSIEAFRLVEKKRTLEDAAVPASAAAQE